MNALRVGQLAFVLGAAVLVYSFVSSAQDGQVRNMCSHLCALMPNYVGENKLAPEIELPDLLGRTTRLSSLRGKTVVLVFWSTSCPSCKQQMPHLADLAQVVRASPELAMLTVAVDDSPQLVRQTLSASIGDETPFPVLLDGDSKVVLGRYGTRLFPETWVIDPDGIIRARFDGPRDWAGGPALSFIKSVSKGELCPMALQAGFISGPGANVCRGASDEI